MSGHAGEAVDRSRLVYVTVWDRIRNPDGSLCCWHPDDNGCPLLGHELVPLYYVEGDEVGTENNQPIHPERTGG